MISTPRLIMDDDHSKTIPIINIAPSEPWDVSKLRNNLRPEDENEILRFGVSIQYALWRSYRRALIRKTAFIDGQIAAMWGCGGTFLGNKGMVWLMTTPEVKKVSPLKFTRIYQEEVNNMLKMFKRLENYVDAEYDCAIRLLDIIGFTIEEPQKIGLGMYRKFWIER